jgi:hypothetical protein
MLQRHRHKDKKKEAAKNARQFEGSPDRHNASHATALWKPMEAFPTWPHAAENPVSAIFLFPPSQTILAFLTARG